MINNEVLNEAKNRLVEKFHPQRIILFGSQARGTADKHSDVDLLIIGSYKEKRTLVMTAMNQALSGLHFACDIVVLSPEEYEIDRYIPGTIARPAWKEGKVIYEH
ncbi:nucleotidyltransferase domain-containing protein [bacterium]|nr:nucleotidyltransferase domain-containing protein [bacterium]